MLRESPTAGSSSAIPVISRWPAISTGDGIDTIGLHRESTGIVYFRQTNTTGVVDAEFYCGNPDDRFVAGDWGVVDETTRRLCSDFRTPLSLRHSNTQGIGDESFAFGVGTNLPVGGKRLPEGLVPFWRGDLDL